MCVNLCLLICMYTSLLHTSYQSVSTCHRCTNTFALAQGCHKTELHLTVLVGLCLLFWGDSGVGARPDLCVSVKRQFTVFITLSTAGSWDDLRRCIKMLVPLGKSSVHGDERRTERDDSLLDSVRGQSFGTRSGQPRSPNALSPENPSHPPVQKCLREDKFHRHLVVHLSRRKR